MISASPPLVSVVIPTYKRDHSLERAIRSALAQEDVALEVLVVDDGSPVPPDAILAKFAHDPRVRYLPQAQNRGGGAARNVGIEASQGTWIALLDSDDWWEAGKLRAQLNLMEALPHPERTVCFTRLRIQGPFGTRVTPALTLDPKVHISHHLFISMVQIQTSSLLLDATLAQETLFDPELPRLQDWDFYLRLATQGARFVQLPLPLSVFEASADPGRISNTLDPKLLRTWIESWRAQLSDQAYKGFMANKLAPELLLTGHTSQGMWWLLQGVLAGVVTRRALAIELLRAVLPVAAFEALRRGRIPG